MSRFTLSRRTFLRGAGGAIVGLPVLECMLDNNGEAYAQTMTPMPLRYAIVFAGQSLGGDGWEEDRHQVAGNRFQEAGHHVVPAETGRGYTMTRPLMPLETMRDDFSVLSNLRIPWNANSAEPAMIPDGGAFRGFHGGGKGPLLCGVKSVSESFTCRGPTSDQVLAARIAGQTRFDSLVYRAQPSWYLSGSSYSGRQYISYRGDGDRIEAQVSPQIAFGALFDGFMPAGDAEAARFDFAKRSKLAVLDQILDKRQRLLGRVGNADRVRLDQHFEEIHALQQRVAMIPPVSSGACTVLGDPGPDPSIGGDNAGSGSSDIGTNTGYSGETERARLLADLIHMAFVCDLTRVATLQITTFQSHMNVFQISTAMGTPIRADLHEVGHNGDDQNRGQAVVSLMLRWHIEVYAHLLAKMKATTEGARTLLDNSAVIFLPEGGHGTQLNDGVSEYATHSVERMVMLVAGRAGNLNPGQHIDTNGAHPVSGLISAMQAVGHPGEQLGEVTGNIPALFT
jgi:hypothetical protein